MKKNNIITYVIAAVSLLTVGCKKILDINFSPSFPQEVSAELYLSPIQYQIANGYGQDQRIINKFTQAMLGTSTDRASYIWEQHSYPGGVSDVGGVMWRMVYFNHGKNLENLLADSKVSKKYEFTAIGYAIKAFDYQLLTDYHGPIVLDGAYEDRLQFEYKDQPDVYKRVQVWCDSALYFLDQKSMADNTGILSKYDFMYGGNMERWRKFIYGIKALNYARYINKPDFLTNYADSVMKYTSLSFASEADNATVKFTGSSSENSNVYGQDQALLNSTYYNRAGAPILRYLTGGVRGEYEEEAKTSSDPRLSRMLKFGTSATASTDSIYRAALPDGRSANSTVPAVGNFYMFKNTTDFPIMTYSQLQFIRAEVALKKGDLPVAHEAYLNGIRGHMTFVNKYTAVKDENQGTIFNPLEITAAEINSYMDSTEVAQTAAELTLADIMGQKYIALWGWGGYDIWSDLRKYRYDPAIFRQFVTRSGAELAQGSYTYRVRPRFNSEYMWNAEELEKWGGLEANYVITPTWFVLDNY